MRVLDLDLDFFVRDKAHFMDGSDGRLEPDEYPPWPLDLAMTFLTERCRLDKAKPGFVVEQHNELFYVWGSAIEAGQLVAPFEVVHVDAHADLGLGDASYAYLMHELPSNRLSSGTRSLSDAGRDRARRCSISATAR